MSWRNAMSDNNNKHHSTAILIAITFLIYLNSLPNEFIFDDIPLVQNSLNVLNMEFLDLVSSYRPLRYITFAIDYRIFGMNPWGFRFMNIVYHSLTVISLFWMLKVFGLSKRAAFISSLLFAIHPVNTDAVAYISGRRDVLMGLFYVLSVGMFMKFYNATQHGLTLNPSPEGEGLENTPRSFMKGAGGELKRKGRNTSLRQDYYRQAVLPLLSLIFMFMSMSSKEMGATIPLIFILYIFYKDGKKLLEKKWVYITVMSFLLLFTFFVFITISGGGSGLVSLHGIDFHGNSPEVHYLTAATIWLHYLKLTVFPLKLILDNANYPLVLDWNFHVFFSVLSMFIYGWVVWRLSQSKGEKYFAPKMAFFLVFFVISLAPVLQIIPLHEIVALHYLYVPVIGFCAIVGMIYDYFNSTPQPPSLLKKEGGVVPLSLSKRGVRGELFGRTQWFAPTIILIIIISLFSFRTITRNFELKDIWTALHADENWKPLSFRGYFTLGVEYLNMKFPDKTWEYYQKSIDTGYWDPNLLGNIIGYHIVKGNHKNAVQFYEEMQSKGEYITGTGTLNVAVIYMLSGNCEKAVKLATSFTPFANQVDRVELVKKCDTYGFDKFYDNDIQDIYNKQQLMKQIGLEIERKPYLMQLVGSVNRGEVNSEQMGSETVNREKSTRAYNRGLSKHRPSDGQDVVERAEGSHYLSPAQRAGETGETHDSTGPEFIEGTFTTNETLDLIRELAVVNLQSDVPEAIKYYKMERDIRKKLNMEIPDIVEKSIAALDDYQYKVLVEGKNYKLEW